MPELDETLPCPRRANLHIGARDRVNGKLDWNPDVMQHAEELPQRAGKRGAGTVVELCVGQLPSRDERPAEERPWKLGARAADENGQRDRQRQQRRESRQHAQLATDAVERDLTARKAKEPAVVDEPGRVVPALAGEAE